MLIASAVLLLWAWPSAALVYFVPELTTTCAATLSTLSLQLEPDTCGPTMSGVLLDSSEFTTCTKGVNGLNCFDPVAVMNHAYSSSHLVPVYRFPAYSQCDICTTNAGMVDNCLPLLQALSSAVYGGQVNYTAFGITDPATQAAIDQTVNQAARDCIRPTDRASVRILEYQSQVLCASTDTFGMAVDTTTNTIPGVLDMRSLMQCGACAVLPCLPGQLCDGNGEAAMCPEGSYCPVPEVKITCPKGSYCPQGSTAPRSCRGVAGSTCDEEGAGREVAWVPMFFAVLFLAAVMAYEYYFRSHGTRRNKQSIDFNPVPSTDKPTFVVHSAPVSIKFENIRLVTNNTVRLQDVSGDIKPGRFTAILGGSGAGKTSLMNVILGREAKTDGKISYFSPQHSGRIPSSLLDRVVAFVPQNDVYLREMTVYELVLHSAQSRSASSLSKAEVIQRVEEVLAELQLGHLKDIPVGGSQGGSSLSPGDRKKVNIALELVADPNVLFLDEPTTGIDASSALNVARIISQLAHAGLTCVAVIHQPRSEIFSLIDDMIILVRGGRLAYQGPTKHVLAYFASLGCILADPKANKTDFLIDLTSKPPPAEICPEEMLLEKDFAQQTVQDPRKVSDQPSSRLTVQAWADIWEREGQVFLDKACAEEVEEEVEPPRSSQHSTRSTTIPLDIPRRGFLQQMMLCYVRNTKQHFKNRVYLNDMLIHFLAGVIMGIVTCGGPLFVNAPPITYSGSCPPGAEIRCNSWVRFQIGPATFLMTMILGAVIIPGAVRCFGREKEVFAREAAVGANKFAYFLGKFFADLPFLCLNVFLYMAPMIAIAPWQGPTDRMYGVLFCIGLVISCMGYLLSFIFNDPDAAVLCGVILAILLNLFGGFVPTIGDGVIGWIMYTHWAARGICTTELWFGQGLDNVEDYNNVVPMNWKNPDFTFDCLMLLLISLLLLIASVLSILYINRRVATMD